MRRVLDPNDDDRMPLDADPLPEEHDRAAAGLDRPGRADARRRSPAAARDRRALGLREAGPSGAAGGRATPAGPRNPIDRFVLARLEREKLTPSPEARGRRCCAASRST